MSEYIPQGIINEFTHEAAQTRKLLALVPFDRNDYKPHEKSMKLGRLAAHVAELPGLMAKIIATEEVDVANGSFPRANPTDDADLLRIFDENVKLALDHLKSTERDHMLKPWSMRNGEHVFLTLPRVAAIRSVGINHLIHHRGQLSVYLRLNNIPIPGMYGPSADNLS